MTLRKIAALGQPVLWTRAAPLAPPFDDVVQHLVDDMIATMRDAPGVGLAAPQVYESRRVIVVQPARDAADPLVLINPELAPVGDEIVLGIEGCLSIPDWQGLVPRHRRVRWCGLDREGHAIEGVAEDFLARVLQHEVDHLDGILYPMRLRDMRDLATSREASHLMARLDAYAHEHDEDRRP
jgi:peptide deformylase